MSFNISIGTKDLQAALKQLEDAQYQLVRIAIEELTRWSGILVGRIRTDLTRRKLNPRTGYLRGSIASKLVLGGQSGGEGTVAAQVGVLKPKNAKVLVYGLSQEFGTTVTPQHAEVMTIPLKAALTASGVPRFTALEAKQIYDRTFWYHNVLYGVMTGKGRGKRKRTTSGGQAGDKRDKIVPLFEGVKRANIAGGPGAGTRYLRDNADAIQAPFALSIRMRVFELLSTRAGNAPLPGLP